MRDMVCVKYLVKGEQNKVVIPRDAVESFKEYLKNDGNQILEMENLK